MNNLISTKQFYRKVQIDLFVSFRFVLFNPNVQNKTNIRGLPYKYNTGKSASVNKENLYLVIDRHYCEQKYCV